MNEMLPPPIPSVESPDRSDWPVSAEPTEGSRWVNAVAAVVAVGVVAGAVGFAGLVFWFAMLWNGAVPGSLALPLLIVCMAPSLAGWIWSGRLAARITGDPRAWWLLAVLPLVVTLLVSAASL